MKLIENIVRGEIYMADLDPCIGSEQGGIRPVVIIQNNTGNCCTDYNKIRQSIFTNTFGYK